MPPRVYSTASARSSPSPPPDSPSDAFVSSQTTSQIRKRVRTSSHLGLTPIRPTFDYSTTNSYLGGESTVDNDTTDGDTRTSANFNRVHRASLSSLSQPKFSNAHSRTGSPDGRKTAERRVAVSYRRESPHTQGAAMRGGGSTTQFPKTRTLFSDKLAFGPLNVASRQAFEYFLLANAVTLAAWRLYVAEEQPTTHVLLCLMVCSFLYEFGWTIPKLFTKQNGNEVEAGTPEKAPRRSRMVVAPRRGYIWMTDEKNYRECSDNGESTATLLGPLIAAAGLYTSISPPLSVPFKSSWYMEPALPLLETYPPNQHQATVASRRVLVQVISLNTLVLFAHMHLVYKAEMSSLDILCSTFFFQTSLYLMIRMARRAFTLGEAVLVAHGATTLFLETINISVIKQWPASGNYVRTFRDPSPLLVFQLALLPGTLLIGFLLSPLLALSRHIARRPRLRLRAPHQTEQLIYRRMLAMGLAVGAVLLVGGLLGGWARWLLNGRDPWLWVLRSLTHGRRPWSRPALVAWWGLLGSLSVAGWNRQLARSRRHNLIHQLTPSQTPTQVHFKSKTMAAPPMFEVSAVGTYPPLVPRLGAQQPTKTEATASKITSLGGPTRDIQAVATDLLDAADKHVPTLSRNGRRKFFHALALLMFVPGISWDPAFSHLSFSLAFSLFTFAEYIRYFAIYPLGAAVHVFLSEFLDEKDGGSAILSHFYLLTGCAIPLWLESSSRVLCLAGVIVLGVGDALASIVGRKIGTLRWFPSSSKTIEGTAAFAVSVFMCDWIIAIQEFPTTHLAHLACAVVMTALLEAVSKQNDNLTIPLYLWSMLVLLPVDAHAV
ncbi:dolichol kinase [Ceratobasidium sp. AG-Ba]|nr:dolichol kinase [Ceratobasidium sp. AG-Ba]